MNPLIEEFAGHLKEERGLSENTWKSYGYQLAGYFHFLETQGLDVLKVTREQIVAYLNFKRDAGMKSATLFCAAIALRQFYRFLVKRKNLKKDPTSGIELPRIKQRIPKPLDIASIERLLTAAKGDDYRAIRNRALLELMYATGARTSEILNLRLDQIDMEESCVRVIGKGDRERIIPFGEKAKETLILYLKDRRWRFPGAINGPLFLNSRGQRLGRCGLWLQLKELAQAAQLNGGVFPHQIRHSAATHMLEGGADIRVIQEYLGHSSINTTQRYTRVSSKFLRKACQEAHPRFA